MEKNIKFYYNLDVSIVFNDEECYLLKSEDEYFYYIKCKRQEHEVKDIFRICDELKKKGILVDQIILNIKNNYITEGYVLVKIKFFLDDEMTIKDIMKYNDKLVVNSKYNNYWQALWSNKIDFLESKIKDVKNLKVVTSSFDYYVGLGENAITLLNNINKKFPNDTVLVLSRFRVNYPLYYRDYFNPLNFIIDSRIRDIAGYLKNKFFSGEDIKEDIDIIFKNKYSDYEYNLFIARMLYPSYYFDVLESVLNQKAEEKDLLKIIDKVEEYEKLLKDLCTYLSKFSYIENINWLNEKEVIN